MIHGCYMVYCVYAALLLQGTVLLDTGSRFDNPGGPTMLNLATDDPERQPRTHQRTHSRTHSRTHARLHARLRACVNTKPPMFPHPHTHTRARARVRARTVACMHAHIRAFAHGRLARRDLLSEVFLATNKVTIDPVDNPHRFLKRNV